MDQVSGLQFAQARYYAPEVGRFSAQDPHWGPHNMVFGDRPGNRVPDVRAIQQSANPYAYCGGNPLGFVDPRGLMECELEARHRDMFQDLLGPQYMEWWYVFNERFSGLNHPDYEYDPSLRQLFKYLSRVLLIIGPLLVDLDGFVDSNGVVDFSAFSWDAIWEKGPDDLGLAGAIIYAGTGELTPRGFAAEGSRAFTSAILAPPLALGGAVIGTAFFGPGLGTAVGYAGGYYLAGLAGDFAGWVAGHAYDFKVATWDARLTGTPITIDEHGRDRMRNQYSQYDQLFSRYLGPLYN